jgi:serralysin
MATTFVTSGNDSWIVVKAGTFTLDGLGGVDTLALGTSLRSATATDYSLTSNGGLNVYNLSHIERINFSNEKIALDLSDTSNAGEVAKVLSAVFGSAAVTNATYAGIGLGLLDGGMSYESLMSLALSVALLGASLTHKAVVDLLYMNVIGVAPPADQEKLYVDLLYSHAFSVAQLGTIAADTPFNATKIGLTGQLLETGLHYV